jgi:endonuclease YncB( thermonuclease family)
MNKIHFSFVPLAIATLSVVGIANLIQSGKSTQNPISKPDRAIEIIDGITMTTQSGQRVQLCGLNQPTNPALQAKARSKLETLALSGEMLVTKAGKANGKTIAELFVVKDDGEELHLNSELAAAGLATVDQAASCPNQSAIALAETKAKSKRVGLWAAAK